MRFRIGGRYWDFRFYRCRAKNEQGWCDQDRKQILVDQKARGKRRLEICIHEMLHAADWHKSEEWVQDTGHELANALWRLGYRKTEGESPDG